MYARFMSQSVEVQVGVSDARNNLTEVIARVRLRAEHIVFTRREKPQAVLVSHDFYRRALAALGENPERVPYTDEQRTA